MWKGCEERPSGGRKQRRRSPLSPGGYHEEKVPDGTQEFIWVASLLWRYMEGRRGRCLILYRWADIEICLGPDGIVLMAKGHASGERILALRNPHRLISVALTCYQHLLLSFLFILPRCSVCPPLCQRMGAFFILFFLYQIKYTIVRLV